VQVLVPHGVVVKGMIHGPQDLGFAVKIDQADNLLELIKRMKFGFGEGLDIAASRLSQGQ